MKKMFLKVASVCLAMMLMISCCSIAVFASETEYTYQITVNLTNENFKDKSICNGCHMAFDTSGECADHTLDYCGTGYTAGDVLVSITHFTCVGTYTTTVPYANPTIEGFLPQGDSYSGCYLADPQNRSKIIAVSFDSVTSTTEAITATPVNGIYYEMRGSNRWYPCDYTCTSPTYSTVLLSTKTVGDDSSSSSTNSSSSTSENFSSSSSSGSSSSGSGNSSASQGSSSSSSGNSSTNSSSGTSWSVSGSSDSNSQTSSSSSGSSSANSNSSTSVSVTPGNSSKSSGSTSWSSSGTSSGSTGSNSGSVQSNSSSTTSQSNSGSSSAESNDSPDAVLDSVSEDPVISSKDDMQILSDALHEKFDDSFVATSYESGKLTDSVYYGEIAATYYLSCAGSQAEFMDAFMEYRQENSSDGDWDAYAFAIVFYGIMNRAAESALG